MMYQIEQDGEFGPMPATWKFWSVTMPWQQQRLYMHLREARYADAARPISAKFLADQVGISRSAIVKALEELELHDFVSQFYDEDDGIAYITVSDPPIPSEQEMELFDVVGREMRETDQRRAQRLITLWATEYKRYTSGNFDVTQKDLALARRLVKAHPEDDMDSLFKTVRYYWLHFNEGQQTGFATFYKEYEAILMSQREFEVGFVNGG